MPKQEGRLPYVVEEGGWNVAILYLKKKIPEPVSSICCQGKNIPFREDIVESAIRATVLVANSHPSVPHPLELVNVDELGSPSPGTLSGVSISIRNGMEYMETLLEVPNLSQQEWPPNNLTRYIDGGVDRNASAVQAPQSMQLNKSEYGIQVQSMIN